MTIPIELIIFIGSILGTIGSLMCHLQIRVLSSVREIQTQNALAKQEVTMTIESMRRHEHRNSQEIEMLQKHCFGLAIPQRS